MLAALSGLARAGSILISLPEPSRVTKAAVPVGLKAMPKGREPLGRWMTAA
jgi:hypothetical protein